MLFKIFIEKSRRKRLFGIDRFYYYYLCTAQSSLFNIHCALFSVHWIFPVHCSAFVWQSMDFYILLKITVSEGTWHLSICQTTALFTSIYFSSFCFASLFHSANEVGGSGKTENSSIAKNHHFCVMAGEWLNGTADRVRHESISIWNCTSSVRQHIQLFVRLLYILGIVYDVGWHLAPVQTILRPAVAYQFEQTKTTNWEFTHWTISFQFWTRIYFRSKWIISGIQTIL